MGDAATTIRSPLGVPGLSPVTTCARKRMAPATCCTKWNLMPGGPVQGGRVAARSNANQCRTLSVKMQCLHNWFQAAKTGQSRVAWPITGQTTGLQDLSPPVGAGPSYNFTRRLAQNDPEFAPGIGQGLFSATEAYWIFLDLNAAERRRWCCSMIVSGSSLFHSPLARISTHASCTFCQP